MCYNLVKPKQKHSEGQPPKGKEGARVKGDGRYDGGSESSSSSRCGSSDDDDDDGR